jgi:hypothetical protein
VSTNPPPAVERTLREIAKFQFVLSEGRKGNHLLFEAETIRRTFLRDPNELAALFRGKIDEINVALNRTFEFETFEQKRDFLKSIPDDIQQALVFGYFQLLDQAADEAQGRIN